MPCRSCEEQGNIRMGNQRKGKLFEQDDDVTKKVSLKVVEFYGKLNPTFFLDWMMSINNYCDWYAMPKNRKVCFVKAKLKGVVRLWWHNIKNQLYRSGHMRQDEETLSPSWLWTTQVYKIVFSQTRYWVSWRI